MGDAQRIYDMLTPKPKELLSRPRRLLREGEMLLWDPAESAKKKRHLFLFNDVLLITKKEGNRNYWLKVYVSLRSELGISDVKEVHPPVEFRLYAPKKSFIFWAPNPDIKRTWLRELKRCCNPKSQRGNSGQRSNNGHASEFQRYNQAPPELSGSDNDDDFDDFEPRANSNRNYSPSPQHTRQAQQPARRQPKAADQGPVPFLAPIPGTKANQQRGALFDALGMTPDSAPGAGASPNPPQTKQANVLDDFQSLSIANNSQPVQPKPTATTPQQGDLFSAFSAQQPIVQTPPTTMPAATTAPTAPASNPNADLFAAFSTAASQQQPPQPAVQANQPSYATTMGTNPVMGTGMSPMSPMQPMSQLAPMTPMAPMAMGSTSGVTPMAGMSGGMGTMGNMGMTGMSGMGAMGNMGTMGTMGTMGGMGGMGGMGTVTMIPMGSPMGGGGAQPTQPQLQQPQQPSLFQALSNPPPPTSSSGGSLLATPASSATDPDIVDLVARVRGGAPAPTTASSSLI